MLVAEKEGAADLVTVPHESGLSTGFLSILLQLMLPITTAVASTTITTGGGSSCSLSTQVQLWERVRIMLKKWDLLYLLSLCLSLYVTGLKYSEEK